MNEVSALFPDDELAALQSSDSGSGGDDGSDITASDAVAVGVCDDSGAATAE